MVYTLRKDKIGLISARKARDNEKRSYSRSLTDLMTPEELERLDNLKDEDIDTSDIPELGEEFWKNAKVVFPK